MSLPQRPVYDGRDAEMVFRELMGRRPAYVPNLHPVPGNSGDALFRIFSRYVQVIIDRLNEAPDLNLLAFLDMMGINLIPAQAAVAPVVFKPLPGSFDGQVLAGTRLGAQPPESPQPLVFETETTVAMAAAELVEVKSIWPLRDTYADHTLAWAGGRSFELFKPRRPVEHQIYLAHDRVFALNGEATAQIEFKLSQTGDEALQIVWEFWDGQAWQPFKPFDPAAKSASQDGTRGFTRSGSVTLRAECGTPEKTTVNGIESYWLRGRLDKPLPPDPARRDALVDQVRVRSVVKRPLPFFFGPFKNLVDIFTRRHAGLPQPDQAFTDGTQLDLSTTFFPFGRAPGNDAIFYFANEEIFSKPGAQVNLRFQRVSTPDEESDVLGQDLETDVDVAKTSLDVAARGAASAVLEAARALSNLSTSPLPSGRLDALSDAINDPNATIADLTLRATQLAAVAGIATPGFTEIDDFFESIKVKQEEVTTAHQNTQDAITAARTALANGLNGLSAVAGVAGASNGVPELDPAILVWEYWDGRAWRPLSVSGSDDTLNFKTGGEIAFVVPPDIEMPEVNGVEAPWLRVRIAEGSFNRLRFVSWYDSESDATNFFPSIEPRPPALKGFYLGYTYRSPWEFPEHFHTYNDFQVEVFGSAVRWPGSYFPAFRSMADVTPALYLGFDRPLPNDLVSLYFDLAEAETTGPKLIWEVWDGLKWRETTVQDETAYLSRPGMISFVAPAVAPRAQAPFSEASQSRVIVSDERSAAVFRAGDPVTIGQGDELELAKVAVVNGALIELERPLEGSYNNGTIRDAALPRFGQPRDWIRARLKAGGAPPTVSVHGIFLNAVWAAQHQTVQNELLGSANGRPNQVLFFTQAPVLPGESIEVRELSGARANVELPILRDELRAKGFTDEDISTVSDPRTGRVSEVWIRWQHRPHFYFSAADDRHYVIERQVGRLIFGDGQNGRVPPAGANNIRAARYRAGGGVSGNVAKDTITQLLGVAPFVSEVTNPRAGEGGADGELAIDVKDRGPKTIRHRGRAVSVRDIETMAREASPGVAVARALAATAANGRPASGWVTVIIVPQSTELRPQPSFALRQLVHDHLAARAPGTLIASRLNVIGPTYFPVGVTAYVAPLVAGEAGLVRQRLVDAATNFLHPLRGGPQGEGWPFGRDVYFSDLAAVLEAVEGVDYVEELALMLNDTPQGERAQVPSERIVVAGPIHIEMKVSVQG